LGVRVFGFVERVAVETEGYCMMYIYIYIYIHTHFARVLLYVLIPLFRPDRLSPLQTTYTHTRMFVSPL